MAAEIIIVEDHPLYAAGLREMAEELLPNCTVLCENTLQSALNVLQSNQPKLIISDLHLGDATGFEILKTLRMRSPDAIVVGITGDCELLAKYSQSAANDDAHRASEPSADLLLSKADSTETIFQQLFTRLQALQTLSPPPVSERLAMAQRLKATQPMHLTRKQRQVLSLISEGLSNKEIARRMLVSPETVKSHAKSLFKQLGVKNRTQAASRIKRLLGIGPKVQ